MQIIPINDIWVEIEGEKKPVHSAFFADINSNPFLSFQKYLKKQEEQGYAKYYMHSMWTQETYIVTQEGNIPTTLLWVRGRFAK